MKHDAMGASTGARPTRIGGIGSDRLTDRACKAAKADPAAPAARKLSDGKGLYLLVQPSGAKLWRLKYRHGGTERTYAIGAYDEITLAEAREERDRARAWLREGKDPVVERRVDRAREIAKRATTFEAVAREFAAMQRWSPEHRAAVDRRLAAELLPDLGNLPIDAIDAPMVLATLKKIEARGALETASKSRVLASQVFRHAIVTGRLTIDPAAHLSGAMLARAPVNRATIALDEMPALFAALANVPAEANTRLALYWLMLTATRTSETRFAPWSEIDAKAKLGAYRRRV